MDATSEISGQHEQPRTPENPYRNGVVVPLSSYLELLVRGTTAIHHIDAFLPVLEEALIQVDAQLYESATAVIAEVCRDGFSTRFLPNHIIPYCFHREIDEIARDARKKAQVGEPTPPAHRYLQGFFRGSDIDMRVNLFPETISSFVHDLVAKTKNRYEVRDSQTKGIHEGDTIIWEVPIAKANIVAHPINRIQTDADSIDHQPVIQIIQGRYTNGIPYCEWNLIARQTGEEDITIVSIGIGCKAENLPPSMREIDTRIGNVNSWDRIFANLTQDTKKLPSSIREDLVDTTVPGGRVTVVREHEIGVYPHGLVEPALSGYNDGKHFVHPGRGKPWNHGEYSISLPLFGKVFTGRAGEPVLDAYETFIILTRQDLDILNAPIAFPEYFGKDHPTRTFLETLRIIRKALSTKNGEIEHSAKTEHAQKLLQSTTFSEQLANDAKEPPTWWQMEATAEAAKSLFFAPREFILDMGRKYDLSHYFPHWNYLEEIAPLLLNRELIHAGLMQTAYYAQESIDGWHQVARLVKQHHRENNEIAGKNDLELIFWLCECKPQAKK